jgi:steroid 5-alpha reductase family enzyme
MAIAAGLLAAAMTGAWALQRATGNAGWVDAVWSASTGLVAAAGALVPAPGAAAPDARQYLAAGMAAFWGLRLALHIAQRTRGAAEDPRYAQFRKDWGADFERRLYAFLMIQAAASWVLVLTVLAAARNPSPGLHATDIAAVCVLAASVLGEGVADTQMQRFRARRTGGVCAEGLWAWSRHPNYFFEFLGWCAYPIMALGPHPYVFGWISPLGPLMMFWLLRYVSGVPPLEAAMLARRGDAFREYQQRVSVFFPLPPGQIRSAPSIKRPGASHEPR